MTLGLLFIPSTQSWARDEGVEVAKGPASVLLGLVASFCDGCDICLVSATVVQPLATLLAKSVGSLRHRALIE